MQASLGWSLAILTSFIHYPSSLSVILGYGYLIFSFMDLFLFIFFIDDNGRPRYKLYNVSLHV